LNIKEQISSKLLLIEKVAGIYFVLTCLLMVFMASRLVDPWAMVVMRLEWLLMTAALILVTKWLGKRWTHLMTVVRSLAQIVWLIKWYPDTYEFNRSFANLDYLFAAADQYLFGFQPALVFSQWLSEPVWSEAFNLGYWSYYPMIVALVLMVLWQCFRKKEGVDMLPFQTVASTILASFFIYYTIYIFLPVAGPQFYYLAVGIGEIAQGHFPALGTYFSGNTDLLPAPGYSDGLFYQLVSQAQDTGERPTAAFPSSHIGVSTIVLMLSHKYVPRLTPFLVPFWALLCCATVYIQAHYFVDTIGGLLSAPIVLWLAVKVVSFIAPEGPLCSQGTNC